MSEQDSELADSETSSDGAMKELADIVAGKKPPLLPAERRNVHMPARPNRIANVGLGLGIGAVVCIALLFTDLAFFAAAGVVVLAVAGTICGMMGMQQVRLTRNGRGAALAGLILSIIAIVLIILLRVGIYLAWQALGS